MENVEIISQNFSEDSVLSFTNGNKITGAMGVSKVILDCCRIYNEEYMTTKNEMLSKGFIIGLVTSGAIFGVSKMIVYKYNKRKLNK